MARRATTERGVTVDDSGARAWSQMTVKINLGDYENIELSFGTSRPVEDDPRAIARMHRSMSRSHERLISRKAEEIREIWTNK